MSNQRTCVSWVIWHPTRWSLNWNHVLPSSFRLSSSTEHSTSSQLMRRHKLRRRRHKVSKIDRVSASKTHCCWNWLRRWAWHANERALCYWLDVTRSYLPHAWHVASSCCLCSLPPSAASQTPPWASTSSPSHLTWVSPPFKCWIFRHSSQGNTKLFFKQIWSSIIILNDTPKTKDFPLYLNTSSSQVL